MRRAFVAGNWKMNHLTQDALAFCEPLPEAWALLGEALGATQIAGGAAVLAGIAVARSGAATGAGRW